MTRFQGLTVGLLLAFVAAVAWLVPPSGAGEKGKNGEQPPTSKSSKETKEAQTVLAAIKMAHHGRNTKAPEALLAAARVIGTTTFQDLTPKDAKEGDFELYTLKAQLTEANGLLDEAIKISNSNSAVKTLADEIRGTFVKERGAVGGPKTIHGTVSGRDRQDTFPIRFRGGEQAIIVINNLSNRGDIDLVVKDDNGRIVAQDRRTDDDASVAFHVNRTQTYFIYVNVFRTGGAPVLRYRLTTN